MTERTYQSEPRGEGSTVDIRGLPPLYTKNLFNIVFRGYEAEVRTCTRVSGASGSVGGCRVFRQSGLGPYIAKNVPSGWHILGDSAFPIREWLLTPYKHTIDLEEGKRTFNYKLSKVRMTIERCFAQLKNRY